MLPLYESKMLHLYDVRWATYENTKDIRRMDEREKAQRLPAMPRYWVSEAEADAAWAGRRPEGPYFAWRGIARTSDVRTAIGTIMPRAAPAGGNFDLVLGLPRNRVGAFAAAFSSFVFDFATRQKLSNMHLQFSVARQLPMPSPAAIEQFEIKLDRTVMAWIDLRVDRLNGWVENEAGRVQLRAELDALMFHVYGVERDEVDYIMETFPIIKRQDMKEHGRYRTKELVLAAYDGMAAQEAVV